MKKAISFALAFVMVLTLLPVSAFAGQAYKINCVNCAATLDGPEVENRQIIEYAEEGQVVYLFVPPELVPEGEYILDIYYEEAPDVHLEGDHFTMVPYSFTVYGGTGEKSNHDFDLASGEYVIDATLFSMLTDIFEGVDGKDELDLDGDGSGDVAFAESGDKIALSATDSAIKKGMTTFTKNVTDVYSPLGRLTFTFPTPAPTPTPAPAMRTVTWKTYDGKLLRTEKIPVTQTVSDKGLKTTRPSDGVYKYTFKEWSKSTDKLGNVTFIPKFTRKAIPIKLSAPSTKSFKAKQNTKKLTVTLKIDNKYAKSKKLTLTIKGKKYSAKTNSKGKAVFKIKKLVKKGTYAATVKYVGKPQNISKKIKIKVK